jgi:8-oxo-dGTP diphosphatase
MLAGQLLEAHKQQSGNTKQVDNCRALLVDPALHSLVVIERKREDQRYAVLPGGGMESGDASAAGCIERELKEELGISSDDIALDKDRCMVFADTYTQRQIAIFTGVLDEGARLSMQGPETARTDKGTYRPTWLAIDDLTEADFRPREILVLLLEGIHKARRVRDDKR